MISRSEIKQVKQLHQKKHRDETGLFIAEGPKVVAELLNSKFKPRKIFSIKELETGSLAAHIVSEKELDEISALNSANEMLGLFEMNNVPFSAERMKGELVLALDDIRDPGNFGTILRIADWFGIRHLLCSESCVDMYNPKVVQGSMGSIGRVEVHYLNLEKVIPEFKNIYASVLGGKSIYNEKLSEDGVVLIGNEARGISENLLRMATVRVSIPHFSKGADSLNAAVASAVICSEFRRRMG